MFRAYNTIKGELTKWNVMSLTTENSNRLRLITSFMAKDDGEKNGNKIIKKKELVMKKRQEVENSKNEMMKRDTNKNVCKYIPLISL